jgi:hypothetical protein
MSIDKSAEEFEKLVDKSTSNKLSCQPSLTIVEWAEAFERHAQEDLQFRSLTHEHNMLEDLLNNTSKLHQDFHKILNNFIKLPKETQQAFMQHFGDFYELRKVSATIAKLHVALSDTKEGK